MPILAGLVDGVIGVDTHHNTLAAAALMPVGGLLAQTAVSADMAGYQALLGFSRVQLPGRSICRSWEVRTKPSTSAKPFSGVVQGLSPLHESSALPQIASLANGGNSVENRFGSDFGSAVLLVS
jgi:hypothetical protein